MGSWVPDWLSEGASNIWDSVKETPEYGMLSGLFDAGDYLRQQSMHGVDLATKTLSNLAGTNLDVSQGKFSIPEHKDPFAGIKARVDQANNFSADVEDTGSQVADLIPEEYKGTRNAVRGLVNVGRDPMAAFIPQLGGVGNAAVGAGFLAPMIPSLAEKVGKGIALHEDQGQGYLSPEMTSLYGEALPEALMVGAGLHGLRSISKPIADAIPDAPIGGGYSLQSPIEINRTPSRGSVVDYGTDSLVGSYMTRPRPLYETLAEHGTSYPGFLERGETPRVSPSGALGEGLYTSQVEGEAPGYSRIRGAGDRVENVRGKMVEAPYDPTTVKGDVSAEKPLFLDEPAPRDLRMKAMIEVNKARNFEYNPRNAEDLVPLKAEILDPNTTAQRVADIAAELYQNNIPLEARSTYKGDPFSDIIKSAGYDLWATGRRGEPAKEMVIPDPRRQFKIGESYKTGPGQEISRPVLADTSEWVPPGKEGPKPIELGNLVDTAARALGYKDSPLTVSRMVEEGGGTEDQGLRDVKLSVVDQLNKRIAERNRAKNEGPTATDEQTRPVEVTSQVEGLGEEGGGKGEGSPAWEARMRTLAERQNAIDQMKVEEQYQNQTSKKTEKIQEGELKDQLKVEAQSKAAQEKGAIQKDTEQTKYVENLSKAQAQEDITSGKTLEKMKEKGRVAEDKRIVSESEKISKAQEKEDLQKTQYKVTFDDGAKAYISARNEAEAKAFVEDRLGKLGSTKKIANIEEKSAALDLAIQKKVKQQFPGTRWQDNPIVKLSNAIKSAVYGGDVGHLLRTGRQMNIDLLLSKHAGKVIEQVPVMFKGATNEKFFNDFHEKLRNDPTIKMMVDRFGLDMPGVGKGLKEEVFHEGGLLEKAPVIGKYYAKPSERAYTIGLNFLRSAEVGKLVESAQKRGLTPENSPETYRGIARAINIISQRGDFSPGTAKKLADASFLFGAPRAAASRFQNLSELIRGGESGKVVRTTAAKMIAFNLSMMALLKAARPGSQIGDDPKKSTFGKFVDGKFTLDPWAGLGAPIRMLHAAATGEMTSAATGGTYEVAHGAPLVRYTANLLAPAWRAALILATGKDPSSMITSFVTGRGSGVPKGGYEEDKFQALAQIVPMTANDIRQTLSTPEGLEKILYAAMQFGGEQINYNDVAEMKKKQERLKAERGVGKARSAFNLPSY